MPALSSDPLLAATQAAAFAAFALALLTLFALAVLRTARRSRERRAAGRLAGWRDALHLAIYSPGQAVLTGDAATHLPEFLRLWNHLRESLRGEAGERLAELLRRNNLVVPIRALAARGSLGGRLAAITALGHLRDRDLAPMLAELAQDADAVLSFTAARALLRIDAPAHLGAMLAQATRRDDWPLARLGAALQELGPDTVTLPVVRLLGNPPAQGLQRLLRLARFAHREQVAAVVRAWLGTSTDPDVIVAAIDFVEDARDLPAVRAAAQHPAWIVRMAAARALGRIGTAADLALLLGLLEDRTWWVRYRAAQAIAALPGLAPGELQALRARARDRFAADMLGQVLAEAGA